MFVEHTAIVNFDFQAYYCNQKLDVDTSLGTNGAKRLCANMLWPTSRLPGMPPMHLASFTDNWREEVLQKEDQLINSVVFIHAVLPLGRCIRGCRARGLV